MIGISAAIYESVDDFLGSPDIACPSYRGLVVCLEPDIADPARLLQNLASREIQVPVLLLPVRSEAIAQSVTSGKDGVPESAGVLGLLSSIAATHFRDPKYRLDPANHRNRKTGLTKREGEVCQLVLAGNNAKQIAKMLGISEKRVLGHRAQICKKLEVEGPIQLMRIVLSTHENGTA